MKVEPDPLPEDDIVAMRALESDRAAGISIGQVIGYYCGHCSQCDEQVQQIAHHESCHYAGEHGRRIYGDGLDVPSFDWGSRGELQPETSFSEIRWGETVPEYGIVLSEVVAWRCDDCGSLDETIFELVHHDECALSLSKVPVAVDG